MAKLKYEWKDKAINYIKEGKTNLQIATILKVEPSQVGRVRTISIQEGVLDSRYKKVIPRKDGSTRLTDSIVNVSRTPILPKDNNVVRIKEDLQFVIQGVQVTITKSCKKVKVDSKKIEIEF